MLVVEIFSRAKMMKLGPRVTSPNLAAREDDRVERDVILAHELVQFERCLGSATIAPIQACNSQ